MKMSTAIRKVVKRLLEHKYEECYPCTLVDRRLKRDGITNEFYINTPDACDDYCPLIW